MKLIAHGEHVLVVANEVRNKEAPVRSGEIASIGEDAKKLVHFSEGDVVLFGARSGMPIELEGIKYFSLHFSQIIAKIHV